MKFSIFACLVTVMASVVVPMRALTLTGPVVNPANGHTYYLLDQNSWTASEAEAVSLGGHLVTVNDAAEDVWVASTFSTFGGIGRGLWTGLNDVAQEGAFTWISGETSAYRNWATGEPNNHLGNEDYVHILWPGESRAPRWNDLPDAGYGTPGTYFTVPLNGVVEVASPVPDCSSTLMLLSGAAVLFFGCCVRQVLQLEIDGRIVPSDKMT
ncbi:MAG: C-type lectin domain-containing protein [Verrucomicrobia bacterium]|nr:C-type lectin domain-containing protein [Verrucomicrobiota bacterium]